MGESDRNALYMHVNTGGNEMRDQRSDTDRALIYRHRLACKRDKEEMYLYVLNLSFFSLSALILKTWRRREGKTKQVKEGWK